MSVWTQIALAIAAGPFLWLAGAVFFDFVHWVLHGMLRSRWRLARALAWPHGVHHAWIDANLEVRWENQRRNVWCHIVPEYVTQLAFTAVLALLLPLPYVVVLAGLQSLVFVFILRMGGLDPNHRPIDTLDAYRPGWLTPPAYHALHHVYPDAFYSAYTKLVDVAVSGGAQLRGRRFVLHDPAGVFGPALSGELLRRGVEDRRVVASLDGTDWSADVVVLCDPDSPEVPLVESFIEATRTRKLPPEVWVVHTRADDPRARRYLRDVRVHYRAIVVPARALRAEAPARAAARIAVARILRGFHLVSTGSPWAALRAYLAFRAAASARPAEAPRVRHRSELLA